MRRSPPPKRASAIHVPPVSWPSWPFPEESLAMVPPPSSSAQCATRPSARTPGGSPTASRIASPQPAIGHEGRGQQGRPAPHGATCSASVRISGGIADRGRARVDEAHDGMRRRHQGVQLRHQRGARADGERDADAPVERRGPALRLAAFVLRRARPDDGHVEGASAEAHDRPQAFVASEHRRALRPGPRSAPASPIRTRSRRGDGFRVRRR